ncbi:hypothetical protein ACIOIL_16515 [Kitasatospora griseola]|uniref:MmyB family transcriptional regulator n=1 Tax=Kitasatospora griseola TaxID=2064 RepID=UPI0037F2B8BE
MPGLPAFVTNDRLDTRVANLLGRALFAPVFADPTRSPNIARFAFLDPASRRFHADRDRVTRDAVGVLRVAAGKNPYDPELIRLIGELSTRSEEFRGLWGARAVHVFRQGVRRFRHPVVGEPELDHESMRLPGEDGLSVVVYSAAPGSAATDALTPLASWSATAGRGRRLDAPSR